MGTQLRQTVQGLFCVLRTPKLYVRARTSRITRTSDRTTDTEHNLVQPCTSLYSYETSSYANYSYKARTNCTSYKAQACTAQYAVTSSYKCLYKHKQVRRSVVGVQMYAVNPTYIRK